MNLLKIISQKFTRKQPSPPTMKGTTIPIMSTITTTIENPTKILLPGKGRVQDKDTGDIRWGYLPYEFKFTTKSEYLAWKALWKHTYAELSLEIRSLKNNRSNSYKEHNYDQGGSYAAKAYYKKEEASEYLSILRAAKNLARVQSKKPLSINS